MRLRDTIAACLVALIGCSDGEVTPIVRSDVPCPTSLQELSSQVFEPSCVGDGCHGSDDRAGGLDLEADSLEIELLGREAALCDSATLIAPGDASGSHLLAKLRGTSDCGERMPVGEQLAAETLDCIATWIDELDRSSACETCDGTTCIDLQADARHCGSCGQACGGTATCIGGTCTCSDDLSVCDSTCVDLESDPMNCGSCGSECGGLFCLQGGCTADCLALTECEGACVDLLNDSNHCGSCGDTCGPGASCSNGQCQCGGTTVSFGSEVQPIFTASCASRGCHDGVGGPPSGGGGGTSLDLSQGNSYESLLDSTSSCGPVVAPGDPEGSLLIGKLTGTAVCTGSRMPKGDAPLPQPVIDVIANWVCQGAQNN